MKKVAVSLYLFLAFIIPVAVAGQYLPLTGGTVTGYTQINGIHFSGNTDNYSGGALWQESTSPFKTHLNAYAVSFGVGANGNRSERLLIANNGNVGIGTSNPAVPLHLNGTFYADNTNAGPDYPNIRLYNSTAVTAIPDERRAEIYLENSTGRLSFRNVTQQGISFVAANFNNTLMRILDNGSVGIGTADPQSMLHLKGSGTNLRQQIENTGTGTSEVGRFSFKTAPSGTDSRAGTIEWYEGSSFKGDIRLLRAGGIEVRNSNDVSVFNVLNNGNVGVGTATSNYKLAVAGGDIKSYNYDNNTGISIGAEATERPRIGFHVSDNNRRFKIEYHQINTSEERLGFFTNNGGTWSETEVFSISKSGNVGIGTGNPQSPWSKVLQIYDQNNAAISIKTAARDWQIAAAAPGALMFVDNTASGNPSRLTLFSDGNVGIGTDDAKGYKLAVNGDAIFTKVKVKQYGIWPDYVFEQDYKLPSLKEVAVYIAQHKHLPEVPSAKEIGEQGLDLGSSQALLLRKIEELTLYIIEQDRQLEKQKQEIDTLKKNMTLILEMQEQLNSLKKTLESK